MLKKILNVKTRLSKDFLVKHLNEETELQLPPLTPKKHTPYFSNILCKFFIKNNCLKGTDCIFSHDLSQFPCPENQNLQNNSGLVGKECFKKDCPYLHESFQSPKVGDNEIMDSQNEISANENPIFISPFI